jgi:hypothetical protein
MVAELTVDQLKLLSGTRHALMAQGTEIVGGATIIDSKKPEPVPGAFLPLNS